jgi:hypothetical protein
MSTLTIVAVQLLSVIALFAGAYGSWLFVDRIDKPADFVAGCRVFLFGNFTNIAIGFCIGDLSLVIAQAGLVYFTAPFVGNKKFVGFVTVVFILEMLTLPMANVLVFKTSYLGAFASFVAVLGAWAMSKGKTDIMNWCWVIADLAFIHIAITNRLLGLGLVATLFVWHGYVRIKGWKMTGLFTYAK